MRGRKASDLMAKRPPHIDGNKVRLRELRPHDDYYLLRMYALFDARLTAFGLPPSGHVLRRRLDSNLEHGSLNVIALAGRRIVGHASIIDVPREDFCEFIFFVHQDFRGAASAPPWPGRSAGGPAWVKTDMADDSKRKRRGRGGTVRIGFRISGVHGGNTRWSLTRAGRRDPVHVDSRGPAGGTTRAPARGAGQKPRIFPAL